ncbi:MAG TPA: ABC transporter substrate-binding protein [Ktedonobacterales bacterium]
MQAAIARPRAPIRGAAGRLVAGLLMTLALAACGATAQLQPPGPAPDAQQILRMPIVTTHALALDPALAVDPASAMVASLIYPTLMALDSHMAAHPWAAQSVDISADGLTLTFHLRSGMRFSDGEPVTAATFAFSLNRALDPCLAAPDIRPLAMIASAEAFHAEACLDATTDTVAAPLTSLVGAGQPIEATDPLTLTLRLARPWAGTLAALTAPIAAATPQALVTSAGGVGSAWTARLTAGAGIGGGLFALAQAPDGPPGVQPVKARLTRNPQFWGTAPTLREIDLSLYASAAQAWGAFQARALDVAYPPASKVTASTHLAPLLRLLYIGLNLRADPLTDMGLRKALALAIDKPALAASLTGALFAPTNHALPDGTPDYNGALVGPDMTQNLTGNASEAVNLAQAFASSRCAGQFSRCPPLTLEVSSGDSQALAAAATVARMWRVVAPGYPLALAPEPRATLDERIASGAARLYLDTWQAAYPDPSAWLDAAFGPEAAAATAGSATSDVAALLAQGEAEQDPAQRAQDYQAAEQLLVNTVAWIPLAQEQLAWQASPLATGLTLDAQGTLAVYDTAPTVVIMRANGAQ